MSDYIVIGKGYYAIHYSAGDPLREYSEVERDTYAVEFRKNPTTRMIEMFSAKCDYEVPHGENPPNWPAADAFKPFEGSRNDWIEFYKMAFSYERDSSQICWDISDPAWITEAIDESEEDVQCQFFDYALAKGD